MHFFKSLQRRVADVAATSKKKIPEGLLTGLKNYWYPILRSQDLGNEAPLGITRIGEKLVLWRDTKGEVHAFADRCAHRGAPLSMGRLHDDDRIECRYHGLRYDGSGQCRLVPTEHEGEDGPIACKLRVTSFPVEEKGGVIWCYVGDVEAFPPPPLQIEPEFTDPQFEGFTKVDTWGGNWLLVWDNGVDLAHVPFLHQGISILPPEVAVVDEIQTERSDAGILTSRVGVSDDERGAGETFDAVEFVLPGCARLWVPIPGGGPQIRVLQYMLPIDAESTLVVANFSVPVENEAQRQQWRLKFNEVIWPSVAEVFAQDGEIVSGQGNVYEARGDEHLIASDVGIRLVRKTILEAYEERS